MTSDGHHVPSVGHHVSEDSQMAVVDVGAVKRYDVTQFSQEGVPDSLNAQNLYDLNDVVGRGSCVVHVRMRHYSKKVGSLRIEHKLVGLSVLSLRVNGHLVFIFTNKDFFDSIDALQIHLRKHVAFNLLQEDIIITNRCVLLLAFIFVVVDTNSKDQLFCIVIIVNTVEISTKVGMNALSDFLQCELGIRHFLSA